MRKIIEDLTKVRIVLMFLWFASMIANVIIMLFLLVNKGPWLYSLLTLVVVLIYGWVLFALAETTKELAVYIRDKETH